MATTSSAKRLRNIVQMAYGTRAANEPAWNAWVSSLGGDRKEPDALKHISTIWTVLQQVREDIINNYGRLDVPHMDPIITIESLLSPGELVQAWSKSQATIQQQRVLWGLEMLSLELELKSPELQLEEDSVKHVLDSITECIDRLSEDKSLDSDLRLFLIDQLEGVRVAILDYRVVGVDAILIRLHQSIGAIVTSDVVAEQGGGSNGATASAVEVISDAADLVKQSNRFLGGILRFTVLAKNFLPGVSTTPS